MDNDSFSGDRNDVEIFSPQERDEINARIEAASARDAVRAPGLPSKKEASRRGLFPFLINAGALLFLAGGILLLVNFQRTDAAEIRDSVAVLGVTERALIREIRNEANAQLTEKDTAIDAMTRRIEEVHDELKKLDSLEILTDEQRKTMEELMSQQEAYRKDLAELHIDKARILTNARIREADARQREESLNARLREQQGIIEDLSTQSRAELENARNELSELSGEAEKSSLIEKQLAGFYANISRHIEGRRYREAADSIAALKEYLATPSFASIKAIQTRRESDAVAVNVLSALLVEAQKTGGQPAVPVQVETPPADTGAEDALRQRVTEQTASIAKQSAALAEQNTAISELQKNISELQERNDIFSRNLAEKENQLEDIKAQNASYAKTIDTLQKTISNVNAALENRE